MKLIFLIEKDSWGIEKRDGFVSFILSIFQDTQRKIMEWRIPS